MNLAPPQSGDVIRYAYLWADEQRRGREEARKERPALVLALAIKQDDGAVRVLALAITHTPPGAAPDAILLPREIKSGLGLDKHPSWIVTTEANAFIWPGPDIRPIPKRNPSTAIYGRIPNKLLQQVAQSFLENRRRQHGDIVPRRS